MAGDASGGNTVGNRRIGPIQGDFALDAEAIPTLRRAVRGAIDQLAPITQGGADSFRMSRPAMADAASVEFQAEFNRMVADGPDSAAAALREYAQRLAGALDQLTEVERTYAQHEQRTAAELRRAGQA